jgi:hypothetical protein
MRRLYALSKSAAAGLVLIAATQTWAQVPGHAK